MEISKKSYLFPCSVLLAITQQSELRLGPGVKSKQQIVHITTHGAKSCRVLPPVKGRLNSSNIPRAGERGDHDCPS